MYNDCFDHVSIAILHFDELRKILLENKVINGQFTHIHRLLYFRVHYNAGCRVFSFQFISFHIDSILLWPI